jgi:hypothetical protein
LIYYEQIVRWEVLLWNPCLKKLHLWEQRIKERIETGMKVNEWCLKNNISKNEYYYWNRKLNERQKLDEEVIFADVTPNLSKPEVTRCK